MCVFQKAESFLSHVCDLLLAGRLKPCHASPLTFFKPQGLCCSKQGSYPFQKAVHTPLCLPSLPDIPDLNDSWDRKADSYQPDKQRWQRETFRLKVSPTSTPQVGDTARTAPSRWNKFQLIYSSTCQICLWCVSEKGKIQQLN